MIAIVKGKEIPVNWLWQFGDGKLMAEFPDERPLVEVAAEWEGAGMIQRISKDEGNKMYFECNTVSQISRASVDGRQVYSLTMVSAL